MLVVLEKRFHLFGGSMIKGHWGLVCALMLLGLSGCKTLEEIVPTASVPSKIKPQIVFDVAHEYRFASIQVDVIAIKASDLEQWSKKSIDKYLSPNDRARERALKKTLTFQSGDNAPKSFEPSDILWTQWQPRDPYYLVVLADIPGRHRDQYGNADKRRIIIPLQASEWTDPKDLSEISIHISSNGLLATPTPDLTNAYNLATK